MKKFLTKSNILIFVCVFMVLICLIFAVILYNRSNSNASIWGRKITCEGKISLSASSSYIDNSGTNWNSDISKTVGNYKYTLNGANAKLHVHGYTNSTSPGVSIYLSGSDVSDSTKGDFGYSNLNTKYQVCYSVDSHYSISISCSGNVPANLSEWKDSTFINWDSSTLSNKATYNTETTSDTSCKVTMTVTPKNYTQNFYLINPTENKKTSSQDVQYRNSFTPPSVTIPAGCMFTGWYKSSSSSVYSTDTLLSTSTSPKLYCDGSGYYVAKIVKEKYEIKLDADGGTNSKTISNLQYGSVITLPSSTKTGYTFKGWKYGTSTYQAGSYTVPDLGDDGITVTFTAQWEKEKYTINFNANGGSVTPTSIVNAEYNSTKTLPTPTRAGYKFSGWKYGTTTYPAGSFTVPDFGNSGVNVTFTAQWTANTYNITFNANGGSGTMSNMSMTYGASKELTANKFTKEGYYFIGWKINYASAGEFVKGVGINVGTGATVTSSNYASHYNLIPFVNNTGSDIQLTSNYSICGIYAYKANGEFIKRCSSYSKTHNIPTGTGFIKIEINTTRDLSFNNINNLTIFGPEEVGYKDKASVKNLATSGTATLYAVWLDTWVNNVTKPTGTGTKESPYLISSAQELGWLANQATKGSLSIYAKQTKVINLSGKAWYPIGRSNAKAFMGNYDGQGYEIIGLTIPKIQDAKNTLLYSDLGLFGYTKEGAIIKNVYLSKANVSGYNNVGIVAGNATNTTIERVLIKDSEIYSSNRYGAISGYSSNSTIQNNLIYLTSATGNSTQGIYSGSVSKVDGCLIDIAGKRAKVGTTFTDWGKVNNTLLPSIAWISQVEDNKATNDDINLWINKKLK